MLETGSFRPHLPSRDAVVPTAVVGAALTLAASSGIPGVLLAGYVVRTIRSATRGDRPPQFVDWPGLARDGFAATVITTACLSAAGVVVGVVVAAWGTVHATTGAGPPAPSFRATAGVAVLVVSPVLAGPPSGPAGAAGSLGNGGTAPGPGGFAAPGPTGVASGLVGLLVVLAVCIGAYAAVVATVVYARQGSVRVALSPAWLVGRARRARTGVLVLGSGIACLLARLVGHAVAIVPFVGPFLGATIVFFGSVTAATLLGRLWDGESRGSHGPPVTESPAPPGQGGQTTAGPRAGPDGSPGHRDEPRRRGGQ
jgi:hypothetical protein